MDMNKKNGLNSNQIKLIAIIAMTIDHITGMSENMVGDGAAYNR